MESIFWDSVDNLLDISSTAKDQNTPKTKSSATKTVILSDLTCKRVFIVEELWDFY